MRRQSLKNSVIERFAEGTSADMNAQLEGTGERPESNKQVQRFMKMVAVRKQQMLEKILFDPS